MGEDELEVIKVQSTPISNREYTPEEKIVIEQHLKNEAVSIISAGSAGVAFILGIAGLVINDLRLTIALPVAVTSGLFSLYAWLERAKYDEKYRTIKGLPPKTKKIKK